MSIRICYPLKPTGILSVTLMLNMKKGIVSSVSCGGKVKQQRTIVTTIILFIVFYIGCLFICKRCIHTFLQLNNIQPIDKQRIKGTTIGYQTVISEILCPLDILFETSHRTINMGTRKKDKKLYNLLCLTFSKQFRNRVEEPIDNNNTPKVFKTNSIPFQVSSCGDLTVF